MGDRKGEMRDRKGQAISRGQKKNCDGGMDRIKNERDLGDQYIEKSMCL